MDLISRQAAIEPKAISEWKKEFREYVDSLDITRDDWKGIIEYINEIPSAQPEHTETHSCDYQRTVTHDWIPVTERLPEENDYKSCIECLDGTVWYFTENGTMGLGYYYKSTKEWSTTDDLKTDGKVVAWLPLPEPYKEGQDEH